ncbi:hypothetical protein RFI_11427, partial [Reticulomyxa filosa]
QQQQDSNDKLPFHAKNKYVWETVEVDVNKNQNSTKYLNYLERLKQKDPSRKETLKQKNHAGKQHIQPLFGFLFVLLFFFFFSPPPPPIIL